MKLGVTSYAYRWAVGGKHPFLSSDFKSGRLLNVFDLLEKVSNFGLEVLQICENVNFDMTVEGYKRLGGVAKSKGITLELGTAEQEGL